MWRCCKPRHATRALPLLSSLRSASRCGMSAVSIRSASCRKAWACSASVLICSVRRVSQLGDQPAPQMSSTPLRVDSTHAARQQLLARTLDYDPAKVNTLLQRIHGVVCNGEESICSGERGDVERGLHRRRRHGAKREGWGIRVGAATAQRQVGHTDEVSPPAERLVRQVCDLLTTATSSATEAYWGKLLLLVYTAYVETATLGSSTDSQPSLTPCTPAFARFLRRHISRLRVHPTWQPSETPAQSSEKGEEALYLIALFASGLVDNMRSLHRVLYTAAAHTSPQWDGNVRAEQQERALCVQCDALEELIRLLAEIETGHTARVGMDREVHTSLLSQPQWRSTVATSLLVCAIKLSRLCPVRSGSGAGSSPISVQARERVRHTCTLLNSTLLTFCAVPLRTTPPSPATPCEDDVSATLRSVEQLMNVLRHKGRVAADSVGTAPERRAAVSVCLMHMVWLTQLTALSLAPEHPAESDKDGAASQSTLPLAWRTFQRVVSATEALWRAITIFAPLRTQANTSTLPHRTTHSALNFRLAELWRGCRRDRNAQRRHGAGVSKVTERQRRALAGPPLAEKQEDDVIYICCVAAPEQTAALVKAWDALVDAVLGVARGSLLLRWTADATREVAVSCACLCRTGLDVELSVVCTAARALGAEWCVPVRLASDDPIEAQRCDAATATSTPTRTSPPPPPQQHGQHDDDEGNEVEGDNSATGAGDGEVQRAPWRRINVCCTQLRTNVALLIEEVFTMLARVELTAAVGVASPAVAPSALFIQMIKGSYYPLMRRHWYITNGCRECDLDCSVDGPGTNALIKDGSQLMASCLRVFVLMKELATSMSGKDDVDLSRSSATPRPSGSVDSTVLCCGTTLQQAMDVAFFLCYFVARWGGQAGSTETALSGCLGIAAHDVEAYVKEMLFALDHNTAKQLWHLRSDDRLFYFAGVRRDKTLLQDEHLRLRYARSTLEVVLAHVLHPSLLWMPLWQLQEMVFIVTHNLHLFYKAGNSNSTRGVGEISHVAPDATSVNVVPDPAVEARTETATAWTWQVVHVRGRTVDFSRLQRYLALRLYVVANTLRALRDMLQRRAEDEIATLERRQDTESITFPSSEHEAKLRRARSHAHLLASLARCERADEVARRSERRRWAHLMAEFMLTQYPTLPAAMEGVYGDRHGTHRALRRMEATIQTALRHNLLLEKNATDEAWQRAQWLRVTASDGEEQSVVNDMADAESDHVEQTTAAAPTCACAECRLILRRERATASLGFVLDGATAIVRRVCATDGDEVAVSPVAQAACAAGFTSASSLIGWRVVAVDAKPVRDGRGAIDLVRGKLCFELALQRETAAQDTIAMSAE